MLRSRFVFRIGLCILLGALMGASDALAFSSQTFRRPEATKIFTQVKQLEASKIRDFQALSIDQRNLVLNAENRVITALQSYDVAFSGKNATAKRKAAAGVRTAINNFQRVLGTIKTQSGTTVTASTPKKPTVSVNEKGQVISKPSTTVQTPSSTSTTPSPVSTPSTTAPGTVNVLYYADSFEWARTSLGDTFRQNGFSAAQCQIPLGSLVQVNALGKSVVVKVNDRPNCAKHPDIIDLSKSAFQSIAPLSKGKIPGSTTILAKSPTGYTKEFLPTNVFGNLSVALDDAIPNTYIQWETLHISGRVTDGKADSLFFLKAPSGKKASRSQSNTDGGFEYSYTLNETGRYDLVVASGMGFSTTKTVSIFVLEPSILASKKLEVAPSSLPFIIEKPRFERIESSDLSPINILRLPKTNAPYFRSVTISQNGRSIVRSSMSDVAFLPNDLEGFDTKSPATLRIEAAASSTAFSLDTSSKNVLIYEKELPLTASYPIEATEPGSITIQDSTLSISLPVGANKKIKKDIYLIEPDGDVSESSFDTQEAGGLLKQWTTAHASILLSKQGQYLVEINYDNGFPAYNRSFSTGNWVIALLPNEYDSLSTEAGNDIAWVEARSLAFVNAIRKQSGKAALAIDADLSRLAQIKAQDMADHNYVGHTDSAGQTILWTAKRSGITVKGSGIGENVAGWTVSADFLMAWLSLSGGHRSNMLSDWGHMGIGAVVKNGQIYYVQVFGS